MACERTGSLLERDVLHRMHETRVHESCSVHDVFMGDVVCMGCVHDVCMTCGVHGMWVAWHG